MLFGFPGCSRSSSAWLNDVVLGSVVQSTNLCHPISRVRVSRDSLLLAMFREMDSSSVSGLRLGDAKVS